MHNKKNLWQVIAIVWAFAFAPCCVLASGHGRAHSGEASTGAACAIEPAEQKYNLLIGPLLLSLMFLGVYQADIDRVPDALKSQFLPKNLAVNFASNYFMYFACNFFHELGHGLAKKILTGNDFKIHLGTGSGGVANSFLDSKYVSIEGLDPMLGYNTAEVCHPAVSAIATQGEGWELVSGLSAILSVEALAKSEATSKAKATAGSMIVYTPLQKIIINLAGGASGILGYYVLRMAIFFAYNIFVQAGGSFARNIKDAFSDAITLDQIVVHQLLNTLVPMQFGNKLGGDAVKIWQELGIKNGTIKTVAEIQPYLAMLAFIALAFKQANSNASDERHVADKVLIGLSNYFLQGFLQFKGA